MRGARRSGCSSDNKCCGDAPQQRRPQQLAHSRLHAGAQQPGRPPPRHVLTRVQRTRPPPARAPCLQLTDSDRRTARRDWPSWRVSASTSAQSCAWAATRCRARAATLPAQTSASTWSRASQMRSRRRSTWSSTPTPRLQPRVGLQRLLACGTVPRVCMRTHACACACLAFAPHTDRHTKTCDLQRHSPSTRVHVALRHAGDGAQR